MTADPSSFPSLTAETACAALRTCGLELRPAEIRIKPREDRWAVLLPGERMAWFAASARGRERLAVERKVLRLLAQRCRFAAPRIVIETAAGFDVRTIVPGLSDPRRLYEQIKTDAGLARSIGRSIGAILIEQHAHILAADVAGWLPARVSWPEPRESIMARVGDVIDDRPLIGAIGDMLEMYEALPVAPEDRVLVHTDLGLHNLAIDPQTKDVRGVFDYDAAAWADRHYDFRYLALAMPREHMLEGALAVYEPALGRKHDRERIWLYNAACACSFLAYRHGVPADQVWCGRTLEADLGWVRHALGRISGAAL